MDLWNFSKSVVLLFELQKKQQNWGNPMTYTILDWGNPMTYRILDPKIQND